MPTPLSTSIRRCAAATGFALALAPFAPAQAGLPTFGAVCDADSSVALLVRAPSGSPSRTLYQYSRDRLTLTQTGVISAPLNAIAIYGDHLYGIPEQSTTLVKVAADGTIVESAPLPGFAFTAANYYEYFLSGTVDGETGTYYFTSIISDKLYRVDLNDVAAGVTTLDVSLGGVPYNVRPLDISFYDGHLYGYDDVLGQGVRIDAGTGEVSLFPVAGLPNQYYGSSWISPGGLLVLNRQSDLYEVDVSDPYAWAVTRVLSSSTLGDVAEDGASCHVPPPVSFRCNIDPQAAFVTGSLTFRDKLGARQLYRLSADPATGFVTQDSLGSIRVPINAVDLYDDLLYGYHRSDGRLFSVRADASVADSAVVPGLLTDKGRAYVAGTIDKATGTQYVFARGFAKAYAIDLDDVAAGATKLTFTLGGVKTLLDFGDFAYYEGFLYGYDPKRASGFKIDAATGAVTLVPVTGIRNEMYPAVWITPEGTLVLYRSAARIYEVDISSDAGWTTLDQFGGERNIAAQRDGAYCSPRPAAARKGAPTRLPSVVEIETIVSQAGAAGAHAPASRAAGTEALGAVPTEATLASPFPNPARDRATFRYGLPREGKATLAVYDVMGRQVGVAVDEDVAAGWNEAAFETAGLAPGTYVVRLQSDHGVATQKLTVVR